MGIVAKVLRALRRLMSPRREAPQVLHVSVDGLALRAADGARVRSFRWGDVHRVDTFKLDLFGVDMICVSFLTSVHPESLIANDSMTGFCDLCDQLALRLPGIAEDWWRAVAFPAFATNHAVLLNRDPCSAGVDGRG